MSFIAPRRPLHLAIALCMSAGTAAALQATPRSGDCARQQDSTVDTTNVPEWVARMVKDPSSPEARQYAAHQKTRLQVERELKKLRATYFRGTKNTETRQVGISKLNNYSEPAVFPLLLDLFKAEDRDVRTAILDHLADIGSDQADATIAWGAVFDDDPWFRAEATKRALRRAKASGGASNRVKWAAAAGFRSKNEKHIAAAAFFARDLSMYDAIPEMINLQVGGGGGRSGGGGTGVGGGGGSGVTLSAGDPGTGIGILMVGTQQAFVSDLQPVVGDNAVAFDPTLSVVTEGVVLRVIDAVVITYRTEVNQSLIALADKGWNQASEGRTTSPMGWDQVKWRQWYTSEFLPYRRVQDAAAELRSKSQQQEEPDPESPEAPSTMQQKREPPKPY